MGQRTAPEGDGRECPPYAWVHLIWKKSWSSTIGHCDQVRAFRPGSTSLSPSTMRGSGRRSRSWNPPAEPRRHSSASCRCVAASQDLEFAVPTARWVVTPLEPNDTALSRDGVRLGLVTNGERWTVVDAPVGQAAGYASWYANLWTQEPTTFAGFDALLGCAASFQWRTRTRSKHCWTSRSLSSRKLQINLATRCGEQSRCSYKRWTVQISIESRTLARCGARAAVRRSAHRDDAARFSVLCRGAQAVVARRRDL